MVDIVLPISFLGPDFNFYFYIVVITFYTIPYYSSFVSAFSYLPALLVQPRTRKEVYAAFLALD